jgi:multiple sugar transport system permease protein
VILTLFLSVVRGVLHARGLKMRGGILLLVIFTAGNLLPPQVLVTPLYQMYKSYPAARVAVLVADAVRLVPRAGGDPATRSRSGFCAVRARQLHATIPDEITEAAVVDGAGAFRQLLAGDPAAVPAGAGRARDARVHHGSTTTSCTRSC